MVTHILAEVRSPPWMVYSSTHLGTPERESREQGSSGLWASSCLEPLDRNLSAVYSHTTLNKPNLI